LQSYRNDKNDAEIPVERFSNQISIQKLTLENLLVTFYFFYLFIYLFICSYFLFAIFSKKKVCLAE